MAISHRTKFSLYRIGLIVLLWSFLAVFIPIDQHLNFYNLPGIFECEAMDGYSLPRLLGSSLLSAVLGALLFGILEEFFFKRFFRRKSFRSIFFWKLSIYLSLIGSFLVIGSFFFNSFAESKPPFHQEVLTEVWHYVTHPSFYSSILIYLILIVATIITVQVSDRFGPGVLLNFIRGKYYSPKEEDRAFMFLDIKSSTTLAETLGHERYFSLLNDFFEDVADPVSEYRGAIYQYVGDQVVISWREKFVDNCIPCFFAIRNKIFANSKKYKIRYGTVPKFKAGCHYGQVTIGEVGVSKRDIVFSGDVMNTTARIETMCNDLDQKILVSEMLRHKLTDEEPFIFSEMGEFTLRGKKEALKLYGVEL